MEVQKYKRETCIDGKLCMDVDLIQNLVEDSWRPVHAGNGHAGDLPLQGKGSVILR